MLRNYFFIAIRNLKQNKLYSVINVLSLAIGLAACLVIFLFLTDEESFDAFHSRKETIYRLDEVQNFTGTNLQKVALSMGGMGPAMQNDYPEVETFTRYWGNGKQVFKNGPVQFVIEDVATVDSTFLKIFDFELVVGDRATALNEPNSMVITERTSLKFFPSPERALGSAITIGDTEYKVTGVLKNVPENSHLRFDALKSLVTELRKDPKFNEQWGGNFLNTYLVLSPKTDIKGLEAKFPKFMVKHTGQEDIVKAITLFLQPLSNVHLGSTDIEHDYNNYRKFNGAYLKIFLIVGIIILVIASVNFMNLTTARSSHRWKEIGVRKTIGARKPQLFVQFIFESLLLALMALVLAVVIDVIAIPLLNHAIGRHLELASLLVKPWQIAGFVSLTIILGLLTGLYPALYMTSFSMSGILKGGKAEGRSIFRSSLVVVQFGLALAMIVGTLIVVQQLSFMKTTDVGFTKDQIMLVDLNQESNKKFDVIKTELLRSKYILGVTAAGQRIGNNFHQWGFKAKSDTGIINISTSNVNVDYDYLKVYGISVIEGRGFSKNFLTDNGNAFVVNEALAKQLGMKNIIGAQAGHGWYNNDSLGTIIGVVKDFNFNSLHHKINTLSMAVHPAWGYDELSVKIDGAHVKEAIAYVKGLWEDNVTTYPFQYSFLDQHFEQLYRADQQMSAVVTIMASLAILISCMGLFGLVAITMERRIKEIGIRKVLGATEGQIAVLLSRNFTFLILLSFIIVSPITWYIVANWLQTFAYRIAINPLIFVLGGLITLCIALVTIGYHTIRSARENPVKALRYE